MLGDYIFILQIIIYITNKEEAGDNECLHQSWPEPDIYQAFDVFFIISMCINNIQLNSVNKIPLLMLYHNPQTLYSFHTGEENYNKYVIACLSDYKWRRGWSLNTKGEGSIKHYQFLK